MARARDLWLELCETVREPDGLPTWDKAGAWTRDKLAFWKRYIDITTNAMTNNPWFRGGLVYLDLFAGAGVCVLRGSGERFPGSALIAANSAKPFTKLIFCEKNREFADACEARVKSTAVAERCHVLRGDCNHLVHKVIDLLPKERALTLTFVDPKGLDAKFDTIARISEATRSDIVALFADAYDIGRNQELHYRKNPNSKLDQVLGKGSDWRRRLDELENQSPTSRRKLFAEIYQDQLRRVLRYKFFREKVMKSPQGPLYRLIYASKSDLGLKFWDEALKEDSQGQKELF